MSLEWTASECARHARAELETIAASLRVAELAQLVRLGRRLLCRDEASSEGDRWAGSATEGANGSSGEEGSDVPG